MAENPGIETVESLLKCVNDGSYVIPYFQREFEWKANMVTDLLESILQNYYTGLILLWDLNPKEAEHESWDPVWGAELKNTPTKAILDGQQRLASLYYAIYNPKKNFPNRKSYFQFYLDLFMVLNEEYDGCLSYYHYTNHSTWNETKEDREQWIEDGRVPLSFLSAKDPKNANKKYIDSKEFFKSSVKFIDNNKSQLPEDITPHAIRDIFMGILTYPFVFYPLSSARNLPDICNIFARVNAKGMKLSVFDLMNAFLYPKGVKLTDLLHN